MQLETTQGQMLLNGGSSIDVSGGAGQHRRAGQRGQCAAARAAVRPWPGVLTGGTGVALNGSIVGSSRTTLEAFSVIQNTTGVISATDITADRVESDLCGRGEFHEQCRAPITQALGQSLNGAFVLEPGVEIDATTASNGTGTLAARCRLESLQLALRSERQHSGRAHAARAERHHLQRLALRRLCGAPPEPAPSRCRRRLPTPAQPSTLVLPHRAGADFTAANPLTVDATNPADVTIAACADAACNVGGSNDNYAPNMVRTGDGFIDVSASGNFVLGSQHRCSTPPASPAAASCCRARAGQLAGPRLSDRRRRYSDHRGGRCGGRPHRSIRQRLAVARRLHAAAPPALRRLGRWIFRAFNRASRALGRRQCRGNGGRRHQQSVGVHPDHRRPGRRHDLRRQHQLQVEGGGDLDGHGRRLDPGGQLLRGPGQRHAAVAGAMSVGVGARHQRRRHGSRADHRARRCGLAVTARGNLAAVRDRQSDAAQSRAMLQGLVGGRCLFLDLRRDSSASLTAVGGNVVLDDDNAVVASALLRSFLSGCYGFDRRPGVRSIRCRPFLNVARARAAISTSAACWRCRPSASGNLQLFANQNVVADVGSRRQLAAQLIVSDADPTNCPRRRHRNARCRSTMTSSVRCQHPLPDQHASDPGPPVRRSSRDCSCRRASWRSTAVCEFQPNHEPASRGHLVGEAGAGGRRPRRGRSQSGGTESRLPRCHRRSPPDGISFIRSSAARTGSIATG